MSKRFGKSLCFLVVLWVLPLIAHGQVIISEIHFNPTGSDGGYEWIELLNTSERSVNIEGWKFLEAGVNHGLEPVPESAGFDLAAGQRAVIADNDEKFKTRFPAHAGPLFDSSFSLSNTGEALTILDAAGNIIDSIEYQSEWIADYTDSNSLNRNDQNVWVAGTPSPGSEPLEPSSENSDEGNTANSETDSNTDSSATEPEDSTEPTYIAIENRFDDEPELVADAGGDRTVFAGARFQYKGEAFGLVGRQARDVEFIWNFGDGSRYEKNPVWHRYELPGDYLGYLFVKSSNYSGRDWFNISVIDSPLVIKVYPETEHLSIMNQSDYIIEVSQYQLVTSDAEFTLPEGSFIDARGSMNISFSKLDRSLDQVDWVDLLYPDETTMYQWEHSKTGTKDKSINHVPASSTATTTEEKAIAQAPTLPAQTKNTSLQQPTIRTATKTTEPEQNDLVEDNPDETESSSEIIVSSSQSANATGALLPSLENNWYFGGGVALLFGSAAILLRKRRTPATHKRAEVDDFDIL